VGFGERGLEVDRVFKNLLLSREGLSLTCISVGRWRGCGFTQGSVYFAHEISIFKVHMMRDRCCLPRLHIHEHCPFFPANRDNR